jgi:hypothetical protein
MFTSHSCKTLFPFVVFFAVFVLFIAGVQSAPLVVNLAPEGAEKHVLVPRENIDDSWKSSVTFEDSSWQVTSGVPGGIGFDSASGYRQFISLDISSEMGGRSTCYIRTIFNLDANTLKELDYMALLVRYDDGFIAYLNGERVASANAPLNPGWRSAASATHEAQIMETFDISQYIGLLQSGENVLAIQGMNITGSSPDFLIQTKLIARKNYKNNFVSELPILMVKTIGNASLSKLSAIKAALGAINKNGGGNKITDTPADFSGSISMQTENSLYSYSKEAYHFIVQDAQGQPVDAALLGLPAGDEWDLSAPFCDKSLLRTAMMSVIARYMGQSASHSRLCHLFINDDYRGIYLLIERKNVHSGRIDIAAITPQDESGDAVTGGYVLRLDHQRQNLGFDSPFSSYSGANSPIHYEYEFPAADAITTTQQAYIRGLMTAFETAANTPANADYINRLNISAFVDYFLIDEIAKNVNGYRDMTLFFKDRDSRDGSLSIVPLLNFHQALGNAAFYGGEDVSGWQIDYLLNEKEVRSDTMLTPFWWGRLIKDARFTQPLYKRWSDLRAGTLSETSIYAIADSLYRAVQSDQVLNFERWPILDKAIWPNDYISASYDEEFDTMLIWLMDRLDWMDEAMQAFYTDVRHEGEPQIISTASLMQNYPNPFNPETTISFCLPDARDVVLRVFDISGREIKVLLNSRKPAGEYHISWDATSQPSGVYFYQIQAGNFTETKRMLLLR